ncbi:ATP dependent RNA helicase (Dbp10), putative [Aspergillus fumigatus A1163]|uniref:ATP-dependent RNA helicase dbp10 n=2 Tax=Aspergillus fumigatus TaxID=746128 RepID=DBP10_ASPFU|nr:ATP dependent RNA helicase (Dbp10), putative [Aspergillus fumigatus Af293]Q8NJM2.1 RecName: Full=ATP-dependent RNA helicase dbp10 [Aspergillus fumigatus Af293]EDP49684.1 ATP dependent RNA helicase (Dbp10), putative [Aspergillus fumigatus A1163]KEY75986.1 ATP dependent RNA helicase Dbp10 [Aspergillus fumigatus]EAL88958.1 ATP dependent RNA helicase (Dbp10), putative [Aspergillus fumigatus Af293]CAD37147.1 putative ATP-dependent RNA helicase [Aspergillus fumigatus]
MPHRAASPAVSENEFDITGALFQNDSDSDNEQPSAKSKRQPPKKAFIAEQQTSANRKASNLKGRTVKKGGGFQAMGLSANLLKAIARKGFSVPTPIQRKTIPVIMDDQDVVGMARTGSGKTAAFVIPMIEKLKSHSTKVGARGLVLSPSRELALQTLKVVKELGRGTDLKSVLLVGGDSLEEQFAMIAGNPDIIIATPGRFLHLKVEMNLDLSSIRYVVFDEADRLFEMGFAAQLTEILHGLPANRQTLLFSATLPKSLVEFARAGLQEPTLVRLDTESKISPDLQNAFFSVKSSEKEGALLYILHEVIKMPTGPTEVSQQRKEEDASAKNLKNKKRKRAEMEKAVNTRESPTKHSTIVFAATKHHVDYLYSLLCEAGFAVSYVYGSLDQTARKIQVQNFRTGMTNILVVTDVAARGIDIPILANVINYDFPSQPKIFVHRVGRTARAGRKGWSYSLVRDADAPYLLDLQLFLGRRLVVGREFGDQVNFAEDVVTGSLPRDGLSQSCEWVTKVLDDNADLAAQRTVAAKGEKLYMRTRNAASLESAKRSKQVVSSDNWTSVHPLFQDETSNLEAEREKMLARIGGYRPPETIFEVNNRRMGKHENVDALDTIKRVRSTLESKKKPFSDEDDDVPTGVADNMSMASDSELEVTFSSYSKSKDNKAKKASAASFQNPEYFMSYTPNNTSLAEDRAYGVHSGTNSNFAQASRSATMDLAGDDGGRGFGEARTLMRWDKRHKKYVARQNDEDGSKGTRLVRGESGAKIAASFRSGRFDAWKRENRLGRLPRVAISGKRFRHRKEQAPKKADPLRGDYEKMKKKAELAKERAMSKAGGAAPRGKSELKSTDDIRIARKLKQKRREKNARPSRKK